MNRSNDPVWRDAPRDPPAPKQKSGVCQVFGALLALPVLVVFLVTFMAVSGVIGALAGFVEGLGAPLKAFVVLKRRTGE